MPQKSKVLIPKDRKQEGNTATCHFLLLVFGDSWFLLAEKPQRAQDMLVGRRAAPALRLSELPQRARHPQCSNSLSWGYALYGSQSPHITQITLVM